MPKPSSSRSSVSIELPLVTDIDRHRLDTSHSYYRASIQRRAVKQWTWIGFGRPRFRPPKHAINSSRLFVRHIKSFTITEILKDIIRHNCGVRFSRISILFSLRRYTLPKHFR